MIFRRPRRQRIITEQTQILSFSRRAAVLGAAQGGIAALLAGRMAWLSIVQNERYRLLAESNRVQLQLVPPRRGWIVDRAGRPIAINRTDFRVDLIPSQLVDREKTLEAVARLLALDLDEIERVREELAKAATYQPVPVAENIPYERFAALSVRAADLPGVAPAQGYSRFYPDGAAVAHLVGYVGAASAKDYEADHNPLLITPGFKIGKEGLEKTEEARLRGRPGAKRVEVTARGKLVRELESRSDQPGHTLPLTIDAPLQLYAARRMGDNSGSAVVLDCDTGELLAMVSMPAYDPNSFSDGIGHLEWDMLSVNDHLPLMNKTLQGLYPPGSTVKPMNALALLDGGIDPAERVICTGQYRLGTNIFHCHKRHGHGAVDMKTGIMQSCDIYFYTMVRRIGIDALATMMRRLGLGAEYDLPVASQRYGTVPDSAWKLRKYKHPWTIADTINASIGQGYTLVNPLQLGVMAARLASGRIVSPSLVRGSAPTAEPLGVDPDHLALVHAAMSGVVNGGGTGGQGRLNIPGVQLAGKTGTAQVRRITMAERRTGVLTDAAVPFPKRDHSLFVCFAPVVRPRYAAAVILEHSGHISTAAPIARDVLTYLFRPDQAMKTLLADEAKWGGDIRTRMKTQADAWRAAREAPAPAETPRSDPGDTPPPPEPQAPPLDAGDAPPPEDTGQ